MFYFACSPPPKADKSGGDKENTTRIIGNIPITNYSSRVFHLALSNNSLWRIAAPRHLTG
ncbi:MAG: hypothetical protein A2359_04835 [Candidatus Moranbacteria bacterium RIFOXYB1_FULL_43_19]|nr:MAG: hypothetical protein A2359_04835 [Candidatus Moranbacteria bacterium RIFOXYB1_FULL_43_19]OGI28188.1 MAG: hypothetical protein A2184_00560 [Candidatus Moranbacteria bacterium RIFOXYA1_FULL_44_7]OGI33929.1 MAG: hypothetical protein A2420_01940 [Candidatus Moranbacteria bacterium RIFOXYC1_FULL_44_13]OGI37824.1 MAG: hypothetical protein A2612_03470 [Candidatus Moranbacteria bacterium RIFOXYD1_FULL_44_12]